MELHHVILSIFFICLILAINIEASDMKPFPYIAHAGGAINGHRYTNSLEALEENKRKGHILFEIDLEWTEDKGLVAIHDWDFTFVRLFNMEKGMSLDAFNSYLKSNADSKLVLSDYLLWQDIRNSSVILNPKKEKIMAIKSFISEFPNTKPSTGEFKRISMK